MNKSFPSWFENRDQLLKFNVSERHKWMCETLSFRKKMEASRRMVHEVDDYKLLFSNLCNGTNNAFDNSYVLEIVSDGSQDMEEPSWYGLNVESNGLTMLTPKLHDKYALEVRKNRHLSEMLPYKTHLEIGKVLYDPALFLVAQKQVWYLTGSQWCLLDNDNTPLQIISETEVDVVSATGKFSLNKLKELYSSEQYKEVINDVKESLLGISETIIWPALLERDNSNKEAFMSLILINSSTWQVPGVWALHAECKGISIPANQRADISIIKAIIDPALSSIHDVMGAISTYYSSHNERLSDFELYRRIKHKPLTLAPGEKPLADERDIYQRSISYDPFERYGEIFDRGCTIFCRINLPVPKASDSDLRILFFSMKSVFVGLASRSKCQTKCKKVSDLILKDSLQIAISVAEKYLRNNIINENDPLLVRVNAQMDLIQKENFNLNPGALVIRAHAIALAALIILTTDMESSEIIECSHALSIIVACFSAGDGLPTRREYNETKGTPPTNEEQILQKASVPHEGAWYIAYIMNRSYRVEP